MNGVFITGTDTDIGKTVVSTICCLAWRATYWKPIQSGPPADSDYVSQFIGEENILPERHVLSKPLSPNHSSKIDGVKISLSDFDSFPGSPSLPPSQPLVVEGAGGVLVPINDRETIIDLVSILALPAIIVAKSGLGTINHTLMTVEALKSRGLPVLGIVMVGDKNTRNRESIERFSNTPVIAEIPIAHQIDKEWMLAQAKLFPPLPTVVQTMTQPLTHSNSNKPVKGISYEH